MTAELEAEIRKLRGKLRSVEEASFLASNAHDAALEKAQDDNRYLQDVIDEASADRRAADERFADVMAANAALLDRGAFLKSILDSSTDCIKVLDQEGHLEFMSAGGLAVMEIDDFTAFRGSYWPDFWKGARNAAAREALEKAQRGETARFVGETPAAKGNLRWWEVVVTPIPAANGGNPTSSRFRET
jgi:PAS domain-containing protein